MRSLLRQFSTKPLICKLKQWQKVQAVADSTILVI